MKLTLGPVLFDWSRDELIRFYEEVAGMDIDRIYIGEVICAKKRSLEISDIEAIGTRLERAGKEVVVSSLAVVSNENELEMVRSISTLPFPVEANDMSVFNIIPTDSSIAGGQRGVIAGPHITTYNVPAVKFLQGIGVKRVIFPVELSKESVAYNILHTGIEAEVFAHGKVPLAFSWRCYTSRAYNLSKTRCQFHCRRYPDGMVLRTMDGEPVFTVNGTSILSASIYTLAGCIEDLREIGVSAVRVSPQYRDMARVVAVFRKRLDGEMGPIEAIEVLRETAGEGLCNGWYHAQAGKEYVGPELGALG